jgi:hypothetical protein
MPDRSVLTLLAAMLVAAVPVLRRQGAAGATVIDGSVRCGRRDIEATGLRVARKAVRSI